MTIFQKIKSTILPIALNIILPTWDVFSDARLIILLLFIGGHRCREDYIDDFKACFTNPTRYCTSNSTNHAWWCYETDGGYKCKDFYSDYETCSNDPNSYCISNSTAIPWLCEEVTHPWYGVMMLVPFILNYLMSIYTWIRLEEEDNKKFTFIFPLLNLYAPYGKRFC